VIEFAGLSNVTIATGNVSEVISTFKQEFKTDHVDMLFMDHWKEHYLSDIKRVEELQLLKKGSVIVADNVITPGCPDYLAYIRQNPVYQSTHHQANLEYSSTTPDGVEVSVQL